MTGQTSDNQVRSKSQRLASLDALRGFSMFWIIGGGSLVFNLSKLSGWEWPGDQMKHVQWDGFSFMDLIFPLFLFTVGVSLCFSLSGNIKKGKSKKELYIKALKRMIILIFLGIIYKNVPFSYDWPHIRYVSVLGRIGVTGFAVTLIFLNSRVRGQIIWMFGLLVTYWASMKLIPVPDYGAGVLTLEGNLAGYIDRMIVPGRLIQGVFDENGFFADIPATSLVLMGALAGQLFLSAKFTNYRKTIYLAISGIAGILLGLVWGLSFPVNKHLWSSSFIMLTGGISFLLLSLFYLVIDVWEYKRWSFFFIVIGLNSITIYLASRLIDFPYTVNMLLDGIIKSSGENIGELIVILGSLTLKWLFLYVLYRKKVFLKI
ncbi:MAG: DUF5009 domain-containing protein [Candidatus Latescibacteria bacterium]|nr:DUF5009 domain-containing protein [Candidatus Latescibacterota bacterium]